MRWPVAIVSSTSAHLGPSQRSPDVQRKCRFMVVVQNDVFPPRESSISELKLMKSALLHTFYRLCLPGQNLTSVPFWKMNQPPYSCMY